ncbi:hypothetical protein K701_27310 [Streptomyces fradiae ATCC 10745 = DSM 40063]|uniref:Uncharacterized protein n=2 Tax=Streptomyces fradiae ATCC 10745 = DSM 40063 TaxID=1319510 RepID=A0ABQ6XLP3_STRFR|nr:hypothetical protein K701_27310 [Streptomyces fradiae ATCC 10745 = DSM 40063]QEV11608.1 hypothetical protein CP974_05845 [Streptomyces fradiae ATCC 10745 = DSM 40063]
MVFMTAKPSKPWRVILSGGPADLIRSASETAHTSETKAYSFLREKLGGGDATTAKIMQWEGGRWWHFETVTADEIQAAQR